EFESFAAGAGCGRTVNGRSLSLACAFFGRLLLVFDRLALPTACHELLLRRRALISGPAQLQRARLCALEEPTRADLQAMMPRRQALRVEGEARLTCERTRECFA